MQSIASTQLVWWSWGFMFIYISGMLLFGYLGQKRVRNADDFATARGSYGPAFLAFAFAATTASGGTFIGLPGLAYDYGLASVWILFLYPIGVYLGVLICMRLVARSGNTFGSRTIPEYLGDRYQSNVLRLIVAIFSLMLFFYLAGQLVSCVVMFDTMLGLSPVWAIVITCGVLMVYVMAGGAHADILTDGFQGVLMIALALMVFVLFLIGFGVEGGLTGVMSSLKQQNPNFVKWLNPETPLISSWWSVFALFAATLPLGLLPHTGNKLWALKSPDQRIRFFILVFTMGLILPAIGLGGLLARALFGDSLNINGMGGNQAIPALFVELFPTWVAALLGMGVLSAVMSTADGLVVSSSQVIANDLYRRTLAKRWHADWSEDQLEAMTLKISRWATFATLLISALLAWIFLHKNVVLLIWFGLGGMMAALAGPLLLGTLWRGVTAAGAIAGFIVGGLSFVILHGKLFNPDWFTFSASLKYIMDWLHYQGPNPYSCATIGQIIGILVTIVISLFTAKLPEDHIDKVFGEAA